MVRGILPLIKIKGSPEELGYQHGRILRDRVRACYAFYTQTLFQDPSFDFATHGRKYLAFIGEHFPAYALEIEALAAGSGLEPWQITVLNARTEIFLQVNAALINECTAMFFPPTGLLGQNWDWMMPCEELVVLLELEREDGHRILMMTEPGIIGKIGMNNKGLGVCLNILLGHEGFTAMPVHIMLRAVLDSDCVKAARQQLYRVPMDTYSHILAADSSGDFLSMELAGEEKHEIRYGGQIPLHTNHYLCGRPDADHVEVIQDSRTRMGRAKGLLAEIDEASMGEMAQILLDHANGDRAICKTYSPIWHLEHGTICSMIMDLPGRTMHITRGNPHRTSKYEAFSL